MKSGAIISSCGRYRFALERWWDLAARGYILWIMLNPSTADAEVNDPTVCNIVERAKWWTTPLEDPLRQAAPASKFYIPNIGGIMVANLYGYRATDPMELVRMEDDPVGIGNDEHLEVMLKDAAMVVCGWGNGPHQLRKHPFHQERIRYMLTAIAANRQPPYMLNLTAEGMPRHPLYWSVESDPKPYLPRFK